jgi:alkylated DNA repair dioxygenase AlkB
VKTQLTLFEAPLPADLPEGFAYRPDFISADEEAGLVARLATLPFAPFLFRGYEGRRRVISYGWRYDFTGNGLVEAEPMPAWLQPLARRAEAFAGVVGGGFSNVLLNEYREGAPIGWHKDRPAFEKVVGVSLLSPCVMRLRRRIGDGFERKTAPLAPRSAYLLAGDARNLWEHSIPEAPALRYSITFRNLRQAR